MQSNKERLKLVVVSKATEELVTQPIIRFLKDIVPDMSSWKDRVIFVSTFMDIAAATLPRDFRRESVEYLKKHFTDQLNLQEEKEIIEFNKFWVSLNPRSETYYTGVCQLYPFSSY